MFGVWDVGLVVEGWWVQDVRGVAVIDIWGAAGSLWGRLGESSTYQFGDGAGLESRLPLPPVCEQWILVAEDLKEQVYLHTCNISNTNYYTY